MITKTFKADTALETLQLVQANLGSDAIVVSMREIPLGPSWNPWVKSSVEIVAASAAAPEPAAPRALSQASSPVLRPAENSAGVEFVEEIPEIEWEVSPEKKLAELRSQPPPKLRLNLNPVTSAAPPPPPTAVPQKTETGPSPEEKYLPPTLKKIGQQLLEQGVDDKLVSGLLSLALETLSPVTLSNYETSRKSIVELLGAELRVHAGAYIPGNVVCLIGAGGSGKTSATAKLALFYHQKLQRKITWVCADTVRAGAVAEARAYADVLGLELKLVYSPEDLREILRNAGHDDLFLVDTPGYNPCNESQMIELGAILSEMPRRLTYLVTAATTKETDLFQSFASLGIFHLDGLIITKLDETQSFGNVYNFARKNQLALSYFTTGKAADANLEAADPARLVSALFGKGWNK